MSFTMEDLMGGNWSMKSHKNKNDEIVKLASRVKTLEDALRFYANGEHYVKYGFKEEYHVFDTGQVAKQALAAKEPKC